MMEKSEMMKKFSDDMKHLKIEQNRELNEMRSIIYQDLVNQ